MRFNDISVREDDLNLPAEDLDKFSSEVREILMDKAKGAKEYTPTFEREMEGGSIANFTLDEESTGTQAMFAIAGPLLDVLNEGSTLVVDELHNNLHPHLMKLILSFFSDPKKNAKGAQLIFSSHDSFIMREALFDDQIWFAEKSNEGASELFCLADITNRRNTNISKSYLDGRFGAVPNIVS